MMEKDYIKIYEETYELKKPLYEAFIKEHFIYEKKLNTKFNLVYAVLQNYGSLFDDYSIVTKKHWAEITKVFRSKTDYLEEGTEMNIINGLMYSTYLGVFKGESKISYEMYIKELADYYAHYDIYDAVQTYNNLYRLMYKLNNFEEFKINGLLNKDYQELYVKYYNLDKGIITSKEINTLYKKGVKNFSPINEKLANILKSKEFYDYLVLKRYIDFELTSFESFKKVFFEDFETNNATIRFECITKKTSILLYGINIRFDNNLSFTNIALSKRFISSRRNILKRTNLSDAFTNSLPILKNSVFKDLDDFFTKNK